MKPFCIISNNCYGLDYYKKHHFRYNTPFIGLFLFPECYIRLLENFDEVMERELTYSMFSKYGIKTTYPIGNLGKDIEIHFLHYKTFREASDKWKRRKARMYSFHDCIVKFCDRDGFTKSHGQRFLELPLESKVLFVTKKNNYYPENKHVLQINSDEHCCPTGTQLESRYPVIQTFTSTTR